MIKKFLLLLLGIFILYLGFINIGKFLDTTVEPKKTDLLVCLGGGDYKARVKKTLEIYKSGFLQSDTIILTGYDRPRKDYFKGISDPRIDMIKEVTGSDINIVINRKLRNTAEEVKYIKKYMIENNLENATFISDAPHSRRILLLTKLLSVKNDDNLSFCVVAAYQKYWDKYRYFHNRDARKYAFTEMIKLAYTIFAYGIVDKLGLLDEFEKYLMPDKKSMLKTISSMYNNIEEFKRRFK